MNLGRGYLALCFLLTTDALSPTSRAFQNTIDTASYLTKRTGMSLAIAFPDGRTEGFVTGLKDKERGIELAPKDKMGIGSATKTMTAAATLKLVDAGTHQLDAIALPHYDALIRRITGRSIIDYVGPTIKNVTLRQLLHMTSGLGDFDSAESRKSLFENPNSKMDLHQMLGPGMQQAAIERKSLGQKDDTSNFFTCAPGACGEYSSSNYMMLGMILAQNAGVAHWLDYDQSSFLPPKVRSKMQNTVFPLEGLIRDFTDVHSYPPSFKEKDSPLKQNNRNILDGIDLAANTGFTVGNALSTSDDMSIFMQALLGKQNDIITGATKKEMMKLRWLETGLGNKVSTGQFYGMGVRDLSGQLIMNPIKATLNPEIFCAGLLYGHDGASVAGFNSFHSYAPWYDMGISFSMNDYRAAGLFNFIARKVYDVASTMTPQVQDPLQAELENKVAFMNQDWIKKVKARRT